MHVRVGYNRSCVTNRIPRGILKREKDKKSRRSLKICTVHSDAFLLGDMQIILHVHVQLYHMIDKDSLAKQDIMGNQKPKPNKLQKVAHLALQQ